MTLPPEREPPAAVRLALEHRIRFVMVDGLVHFPEDAITDYQSEAS